MAGQATLQRRLGHRFAEPALLEQALTHASTGGRGASNERLEFLGDRVLGLVVARMLFDRFADEVEGALARRHTALVRREALARVAAEVGLGDEILMSAAEADGGGRDNPALLANACEAVIAALYLDGGYTAAERFIRARWAALMEEDQAPPKDAKTALQEWAQAAGLPLPVYQEVGRTGPAHAPEFTVEARVEGRAPTRGVGTSKRAAEQVAAEALLEAIGA
ncbi:MAG: ribonuclease III [Hyphomicrobiales bacterium]|nr:ribonuclease III [Hyphomicrobiales bacterium]